MKDGCIRSKNQISTVPCSVCRVEAKCRAISVNCGGMSNGYRLAT